MNLIRDVVHPESYDSLLEWVFINQPQKEAKSVHQFILINKLGKNVPIEISTGFADFDGKRALVCYVRDITEKLQAEEKLKEYSENLEIMVEDRTRDLQLEITDLRNAQSQLVQSEKLASIGQLAAGIAHEINTPIQYVGDNTRFLQDAFNDLSSVFSQFEKLFGSIESGPVLRNLIQDLQSAAEEADLEYLKDEIPRAVDQTLEGVERVSQIVNSMKEFSHPGVKEKTAVDINRAIENTITVSRNEWKYVAEMEVDLDKSLPLVPCLPGELNQVFLNLIINASHAIKDVAGDGLGEKGVIKVSTRKCGDCAEIRISDTGPGIPEEIRARIFDPFFTTKEVGKGTGQGLAIARSVIVEKHGGDIRLDSDTGKGTTFVINIALGACS